MEGNIAKEVYGDSLRVSKPDSVFLSVSRRVDERELIGEDGSMWGNSDEELDRVDDLEREWERRHEQFHNIGYRDGIIAGKEAAAQEGFNFGFKQSVLPGYNWGLVRGITSAVALLPDELRGKLIEKQETRCKIGKFQETVYSFSTQDSFELYHNGVMKMQNVGQNQGAEPSPSITGFVEQRSLESFVGELQSFLAETPAIDIKFAGEEQPVP